MFRAALSALLGAGLVAAAVADEKKKDTPKAADAAKAEPKKEKPKAPPRIAVDDPAKAKDDADFPVQGEYEGDVTFDGKAAKVGVQVVAQGGGQFMTKAYHGGLPGAGWDGKKPMAGTAAREADKVAFKDEKGDTVAELAGSTITLKGGEASGSLKRVERSSPTIGAKPPEGAVVLFGGPGDEKNWAGGKLVMLSDGEFLGVGVSSKQTFGSLTAHVEFRLAWMPNSRGQGRSNSGVYPQNRYEIQVLDSFGLTGENNECGGIYTQHKPKVNMCLPPLVWQTYDLDLTAARFDADGKKTKNARLTLRHNGVVVHDDVELPKECPGGQKEGPSPGPFQFQNHGDPVVYRNVWAVEKK